MIYRIENKISGKGFDVATDDELEAIREAQTQCTTDQTRFVVWQGNVRVAEVSLRGCDWRR